MTKKIVSRWLTKLGLAAIMTLALVYSLPVAVQADSAVIDLVIGGEGAGSWNSADIKPGDRGSSTTTLHNTGSKDGMITLWINNIVNTEGANPESETGDIAEPGELNENLLFTVSCNRLETNIPLPTRIDNMPESVSSQSYLKINQLNAGETLVVEWRWELPTQAENDIHGDSLSFTINYLLEELPNQGGEWGGTDSPPDQVLRTSTPEPLLTPTPMPSSTPASTPIPTTSPTNTPTNTPVSELISIPATTPVTSPESLPTPTIPAIGANWPLIGGIIAGAAIVGAMVYFLGIKRVR